jgi:hypothetical protein
MIYIIPTIEEKELNALAFVSGLVPLKFNKAVNAIFKNVKLIIVISVLDFTN